MFNTEKFIPFTLKAIRPVVIGVGQNVPVLQLPSEVHMRLCDTVMKCPLPCTSYGGFKKTKISASEFGTVIMQMNVTMCR